VGGRSCTLFEGGKYRGSHQKHLNVEELREPNHFLGYLESQKNATAECDAVFGVQHIMEQQPEGGGNTVKFMGYFLSLTL